MEAEGEFQNKNGLATKNSPISVPPMMFIWKIFGYSSLGPHENVLRIHTL
jgi:hypothetical protein